ncbi:monocarboxylate transporter 12 [Orussus abietinus]|uniref:monocarboxylate transporter 12 n=1 Tax=Orussus abietinus TaxID=222816 RepID=UPI000624FC06|nr:monocarboxylate transporter 12 [Orussus abietinus]XP_012286974.1 monocarboxylate transporter 12 [Orussus abietinus]XP_012286976.1 monocarboxylate transporter 12 [Orussus abietinus]XP_012286977.1 monocarboxylate transporter 12 [Orussus abietinus]XP_012286978.1 monocarboxylate transporter 12 [Orussus abietinus]
MAHVLEDSARTEKKKRAGKHGALENAGSMKTTQVAPKPPDGGWGWFVVFASFMIHLVSDGVMYSFGIFYLEFLYYFEEGKGKTAWIASLLVGVTLCSGPISSSFVNKYGCQAVTIAGTILASTCLVLSAFAQNILTLYFSIGIGTGLGFGLIYLPAIVSVTCYFEKYRSLATGIAVCGSGLGTFVFAPFCEMLIATYGWRGAMVILGGMVFNCTIFGLLFRPLEPSKSVEVIALKELTVDSKLTPKYREMKNDFHRPRSVANVNNTKYLVVSTDERNNLRTLSQPMLATKPIGHHGEFMTGSFGSGIMNRRDVFFQRSLDNVRKRSGSLGHSEENINVRSSLRSLPNGTTHKQENFECLPYAEETIDILHEMLELSLLKDPVFILFSLSNFCTSIGFNIPYVYLVAQAKEQGMSKEDASYLLSVIGIANTIGRVALGYVSDKPWINRLLVYNICLTVCGLSTAFSVFCRSFTAFAFYSTVYGFTAGAYVGLTSVILVDLLGLDHLTNAFGLLLLFQGVASLLGPPIAGWLYDVLHSYDPGFYVAGSMIAISGLMLFCIPVIQRNIQQKAQTENVKCGDIV